jgi:YidC/Oxa1 family membrane protein insertase
VSSSFDDVPGADTPWQVESGETLGVGSPVTLVWDNGNGLVFRRTIAVDDNFMFSVTQRSRTPPSAVRLAPYGIVARHGLPDDLQNFFILHEGVVRRSTASSTKSSYDNVTDLDFVEREGAPGRGRAGRGKRLDRLHRQVLDDHADPRRRASPSPRSRATSPAPTSTRPRRASRRVRGARATDREVTTLLFAGAKEWETIRDYRTRAASTGSSTRSTGAGSSS